jgi:uncharacterized radical SAM superfamily Fe-S cluster-containing enzyme
MIIKESTLKKGLPKKTGSLCPECGKIIEAEIRQEGRKVRMFKTCPEHGHFADTIWSDVELYLKAEKWAYDGVGVKDPAIKGAKVCPNECGLCDLHVSHTALANLDLTNRCNLRCPICFANANQAGYVYEPSFEQVVEMMKTLRAQKPVPTPAIQFAGGEPTIYPRFFDVIAEARRLGFPQIQVATNGIKMAEDPEFTQKMLDAGMHTIYLQFDGLREENYVAARGRKLLDVKLKAIESVKNTKPTRMSIILVPTIVKGMNNDQVGEILKFAIKHRSVIRGVNFQPVAFTGRIDQKSRDAQRYTLTDLIEDLAQQTDFATKDDWYNVPSVTPVSELLSVIDKDPKVAFTSHPHCGMATFLFIDKDDKVTPITRFVDVEGLMADIMKLAKASEGAHFKFPTQLKAFNILKKHLIKDKIPDGMSPTKFLKLLSAVFSDTGKASLADFTWSLMFVGGMHFQDGYNYDIERVKRCVIHYAVPDGRIIPFCAYNGGPTYRTQVEKKYSVPLAEWKAKHGNECV